MLAACPFPANHGTPGSIREIAESVAGRGHAVHVVTYHIGEPIPVKGPQVHRITPLTRENNVVVGPTVRRPLYDVQMVFKTLEVCRRYRVDVVHAHGYEAALIAWVCRVVTGIPVVYSGHNTMADELPSYRFIRPQGLAVGLARLLDAVVPRLADRCIPHSENMHQFFTGMGLGARTEPVLNFGIDLEEAPRCNGLALRQQVGLGRGPVVLYAGVMNEFQRLDLLLAAMQDVVAREPAAQLLLVVTIPHEQHLAAIRRCAADLGIAAHVILTDPQPLEAVRELLAVCDVAVVPRPGAPGFPIKLLNYMAAQKPCVLYASSSSGLTHGINAFLAAPDTSQALAAGILAVLHDRALRQRLAENGYRYVRTHHDRRLIAARVCAIYQRVLGNAVAASPAPAAGNRSPSPVWPTAPHARGLAVEMAADVGSFAPNPAMEMSHGR
jgi:glycosyltransferase involved in cell wall biosynthesis